MRGALAADGMALLFDSLGGRKYVCEREWRRFLAAAAKVDAETGAFCRLLAYTGCRISEGLALTPSRLDAETGRVVFLTLKRRKHVHRAVPVPPFLMEELIALGRAKSPDEPLWAWCRQTGWRRIKAVMASARISGVQASPKGLRHGFGVANAETNVPAALTQKWMGHARVETTFIYQNVVGREERALARRIWRRAVLD